MQEAFDEHHRKVDMIKRGKSQHGKFLDNSYINETLRGEHFRLYHRPHQNGLNDGQHTGTPDIDDDCTLPLLKEVVKEVIERWLLFNGRGQIEDWYDRQSNNVFQNSRAIEIYETLGNAGENSNAVGRGEGGGQLPMTAESTYNFFCKLYGVEFKDNSWVRVTEEWPYPAGIRMGAIGIGYGEECCLLVLGWREIDRVLSGVPPLHVIGFEIDPAVSKKCHKNIQTVGVQGSVRCFTADFLAVGVIAEFESSLVAHFNLSFLYTTAAVNQVFALHVHTYAILHGLVLITDEFNSKHFMAVHDGLFPLNGKQGHAAVGAAVAQFRLSRETRPVKMCDAIVGGDSSGGDDTSSVRPLFVFDCRDAVLDAQVRSSMVKVLAPHIKRLTEEVWQRSKGDHHTKGFCCWINKILDSRNYRGGESFFFVYSDSPS